MLRIAILLTLACLGAVASDLRAGPGESLSAVDTVVVCPEEFQPALQRWLDWRTEQGHRIAVVSPAPIAAGIAKQIRDFSTSGSLRHVLLVGDVVDPQTLDQHLVATNFVRAKVNVKFGSNPEIATDSSYADLDSDGLPDLAIGRIPVDSAAELVRFVDRIIEYESQPNRSLEESLWQRRINFVAGVGGFGKLVDSVVQQTTRQLITELVPAFYQTTMTFGSWSSPYCPDPRRFSETTLDRFNEGCLFWVYVGHGHCEGLDYVRLPDQVHPILDNNSACHMACQQGSPVAIFLACYTGATDHHRDCLAETMLRQPRGPIAVVCGTRVTMPYAMSLLSMEMMNEYFEGDCQTLGELMRIAKCRLVDPNVKLNDGPNVEKNPQPSPQHVRYREMIEGMGQTLGPNPELLEEEKLEHVQLVQLLGDPLLRIKRPEAIIVEATDEVEAGNPLWVAGQSPVDGEMLVELVYDRDRFRQRPKRRRQYLATDAAFNDYQTTYQQAQTRLCSRRTIEVSKGSFRIPIDVPADAFGRCQIRVTIANQQTFSMGAAPVRVTKPVPVQTSSAPSGEALR